jgi:hypothetical protein
MSKRTRIALAAVVVVTLSAATFFGYRKWSVRKKSTRDEVLAVLPAEASAVLFADFGEFRQAPFVAQLYAWTPKPQIEPEYAQFVKETGFDYEKDLDRIAIAIFKNAIHNTFLAVVKGRFDQKRISEYALQRGKSYVTEDNRTVFFMPSGEGSLRLSFMFLRNDLFIITNDDLSPEKLHDVLHSDAGRPEWHTRFERLAGSPIFAVIKQNAALGTTLAARTPSGLRSPQLSTLLDQLQWITLAGKPDNDRLRVVAEGECSGEATVRQLADVMNGVLMLAEGGLNDAKTRRQLDPAMREAYLELLKSADVSKIDRGDSKSVRLVFDITPAFLEAARKAPPAMPEPAPSQPLPRKTPAARKGRT